MTARVGFTDGTWRLFDPARTVERALAVAAQCGITRVADVTGLDTIGLPVVAVYRPNARSRVVSQGKGLTLDAARASGLMEAIEGWHAERPDRPLRRASLRELHGRHPLCQIGRLPRVSTGGFHPDRPLLWCAARDRAADDAPRWLPYELVHTDFRLPLPEGSGCFTMSSNGLASGNHLLEAESHAICELVERDALALWHAAGGFETAGQRLDLATVDDPACRQVIARIEAAGLALGVWDITSDIGLPCYAALLVDREADFAGLMHLSHGSGCHLDPAIALLRTLNEAAQTRLTFICGARDDADRAFFDRARDEARLAPARRAIDQRPADIGFSARHSRAGATFEHHLATEIELLAAVGIDQVLSVDLTRPDIGIPVVRVVIPGLESLHDIPGAVPGARARAVLERTRG